MADIKIHSRAVSDHNSHKLSVQMWTKISQTKPTEKKVKVKETIEKHHASDAIAWNSKQYTMP